MTRHERYLKELQRLKDASENHITSSSSNIQNAVYDALLDWIDNTLEVKGGELIASPETINLLNEFTNGFQNTITRLQPFKKAVADFIKSLAPIGKEMISFQKDLNSVDPDKAGVSDAQKLVVSKVVDAYMDNGLNANFIQPVRDLLYQNISSGTRLQQAKQTLKDYVKGGNDKSGKLERYITQTAQQAVDGYTGAINKKLMDTFDYKHLIVSGSLIASSSPQCRFAINELQGIMSQDQWEKEVKPIADNNGLIAGTNFENLPINKMHWGCRHEFTPILLQDGDTTGANEIFSDSN